MGLSEVLSATSRVTDESVLVGMDHPDDGGVLRMPGGDRLIQTVDLIAPIVNDPSIFGKIACANALSDVYAMGGRPFAALNIACFPQKKLPLSILKEVIEGANETLREARCALVGGHTVADPEFKFGFAVSGVVESGEILSIDRAAAGDVLVLTKPIGSGVVNQALRKRMIDDGSAPYLEAQASMCALNAPGLRAARAAKANAATDITGFGLLGHASQFARASRATFEISGSAVPVFGGVKALIAGGAIPGRAKDNIEAYAGRTEGIANDEDSILFFDPQTSGGLLVSVPEDQVSAFFAALGGWPFGAAVIGRVLARGRSDVVVR